MTKDFNSSQAKPPVTEDLEIVLEAARRANWDAQHGPAHLRSGRFFISALHRGHLPKPAIDESEAVHADDLNSPT